MGFRELIAGLPVLDGIRALREPRIGEIEARLEESERRNNESTSVVQSLLGGVVSRLFESTNAVQSRLNEIETKLVEGENRLLEGTNAVQSRLNEIETRLVEGENRLLEGMNAVRSRLNEIETRLPTTRFEEIGARLGRIEAALRLFDTRRATAPISTNFPTGNLLTSLARSWIRGVRPPPDWEKGRVLMISGHLGPGGAERQIVHTIRGLDRPPVSSLRLLCNYLTPNRPERFDFYLPPLLEAGVDVREIAQHRTARHMAMLPTEFREAVQFWPYSILGEIVDLYWEIRNFRPEVVHAWMDYTNTRAGLAAALAGVPKIVIAGRNLNPTHFRLYQPYMDPIYQALLELPNVTFINNSRAGADDYAQWLSIPEERISVIHNAVVFPDLTTSPSEAREGLRNQFGWPKETFVVGGMFRLADEKRPLLWLDVAAETAGRDPRIRFVIWGQGYLREQLLSRIEELGLAHAIVLAGVTDDPLVAMLSVDVLLLTSSGEGLPNVLLETQWVGTPIVTTRAGGTAEAVENGVTAWVVDEADPKALANRILWWQEHDAQRMSVKTRGPKFVRQNFGLDRMIAETLKSYGFPAEDLSEIPLRKVI
jgi:glycosyltransferase involved in cell wall biosynthesis/tetrahydromethanopterin S-methyltransferase subunit G